MKYVHQSVAKTGGGRQASLFVNYNLNQLKGLNFDLGICPRYTFSMSLNVSLIILLGFAMVRTRRCEPLPRNLVKLLLRNLDTVKG